MQSYKDPIILYTVGGGGLLPLVNPQYQFPHMALKH